MSTFFRSLTDKRSALVYIDDILLLANEKQEMFELIKELHTIASRENLKLAPEKSFYVLLKVKFLGHEIGNNTIKLIPSKIEAIKRIPSPKEKKDVMQFLGSVNFYSKFIEKLHINLKPLYTLLHDDVKFQWTPELEKLFQNVKNAMTADTELTIPNTTHPFFITVDASLVGLGAVLFQMNEENKMKVISYNSRILNTQEQKLSTLDRELLAIVYALQIYEFLIIGSPHPIYLFTDHKPLLHCFAKKGNLSPRFYRAQMQLTKFSKLKIIHTPGKNLTVADMLSRTFTKEQLQEHQLRHKQLPPQIDFSIMKDNQLKPVHYLVKHEEIKYNQKNDCLPILADYGDDQFSIRINNKGEDIHIKPLDSFSFQSIVPFESKYKRPTKKQAKSLLQQSAILNDTDILSDEDEITPPNNIQQQNSNIVKEHTLAIQYPTKSDYCTQQVPFFDPSFFKYKKYFNYFFLPEDTQITIETIKTQQNQDTVLQTASIQTFSENASYFNYRISMDTKGPINPPSNQNSYIHVIVDAFSHFVVTVPIKQNNAQNAVNSLLHHWITKFGPPVYLVTDRGTEYINSEFANLCTTMGIRHSPRTPYAPWTNGLVENQNRNLGTHLRLFLHNTPENWSTQVHIYAYAHNSQPFSESNLSPYEIVFHTIPRIPINFELNCTDLH